MKALAFCFLLLSSQAFAQGEDRGFFFKLGEKILVMGGYSYLELEKKLAQSDKQMAECLTESALKKKEYAKKDEELKACQGGASAESAVPETEAIVPAPEAPKTP